MPLLNEQTNYLRITIKNDTVNEYIKKAEIANNFTDFNPEITKVMQRVYFHHALTILVVLGWLTRQSMDLQQLFVTDGI